MRNLRVVPIIEAQPTDERAADFFGLPAGLHRYPLERPGEWARLSAGIYVERVPDARQQAGVVIGFHVEVGHDSEESALLFAGHWSKRLRSYRRHDSFDHARVKLAVYQGNEIWHRAFVVLRGNEYAYSQENYSKLYEVEAYTGTER